MKMKQVLKWGTALVAFAALAPASLGWGQSVGGAPYTSFLLRDFRPFSISRGSCATTFSDDADAINYNPAIGVFLPKSSKATLSFTHAFLPLNVFMDSLGIYFKPRTRHFYVNLTYFASDTRFYSPNRDWLGEINSQTFHLLVSTGNFFPKSQVLSWGLNIHGLSGRSWIFERTMFAIDGGLTLDLPKQKMRFSAVIRNLGFDLNELFSLNPNFNTQYTNNANVAFIPATPYNGKWPVNAAFGFQYQLFSLLQVFAELDFYFADLDSVKSGTAASILDGVWKPHVALSLIGIKSLKLNIGRVFRTSGGESYFTFGGEYNITVNNLPPLTLSYAFEPIPGFTDNHYLGLMFRFQ
ncbi:MAG: hypothetical protein J0L75_04060 [Spirochaetes bacterium]|nr:hypothetical protein [Spirochaetota bacterium]